MPSFKLLGRSLGVHAAPSRRRTKFSLKITPHLMKPKKLKMRRDTFRVALHTYLQPHSPTRSTFRYAL